MSDDLRLIEKAKQVVKPRKLSSTADAGGVGAALLTDMGNIYTGVCINAACSLGFCAEHTAIANMITQGESKIISIVAVDWDGSILPPCGRCREFIYQVNSFNINTRVILSENSAKVLKDLLPMPWRVIVEPTI